MTVVTRNFTYVSSEVEDTKFGISGWRLADRPTFDPCHALHVVCHDTFEHHDDDLDTIEHEMVAFGALYFIRVHGKWNTFVNSWIRVDRTMYSDIRLFLGEYNDWVIEDIDHDIIPELQNDYYLQYENLCEQYEDSDSQLDMQKKLQGLERAFKWISKGYLRARNRWNGVEPRTVCQLFESTVRKLEEFMRWEAKEVKHGDTLSITFDIDALTSSLSFDIAALKNKLINLNFRLDKAA